MTDPAVKLARMANQIAAFFASYPEDQAIAGVQQHIKDFWAPRMIADLAASLDEPKLGLDPLVIAAFLRFSDAESPTRKAAADPEEVGQLGSDAG